MSNKHAKLFDSLKYHHRVIKNLESPQRDLLFLFNFQQLFYLLFYYCAKCINKFWNWKSFLWPLEEASYILLKYDSI